MCRSHKRSHTRQFFGAPSPPRRVLGLCARWGRYWFFIFCRGGPCPPGAYNLAGETQLMHTYTVNTISDYHNIDHNCMRPGKRSVRGWGLREGVLVKMGFVFWLNRSKLSDTFLLSGRAWGTVNGKGNWREQRQQGWNARP